MAIEAHHPHHQRQFSNQVRRPLRPIHERSGIGKRRRFRIAAQRFPLHVFVEIATHRQPPQRKLRRPTRRARLKIPEFLRSGRQRVFDEQLRRLAVRRTAQERDRIDRIHRAASRSHEAQPRHAPDRDRFRLSATVEIDADARRTVALRHIDRRLLR